MSAVCPTTLKRICRQHGIARWPSRKIKKVGHSLKKLQLVINSVQGAEGSIQLSSFYTNFPELNNPIPQLRGNRVLTANINDLPKQHLTSQPDGSIFNSGPTTSNSNSGSTSSTSGHCFPSGSKISSTITDNFSRSLKRERSEEELTILDKKEFSQILERSQSNKAQAEHHTVFSKSGLLIDKSRPLRDTGVFKAKATFGEEKVRFTILPNMGFKGLQQEMAKRFDLVDWNKIGIKYLDDDKEWVLLTCDADLEECIDIHRSSGSHTTKLSLSYFRSSDGSIQSNGFS